MLKLNISGDSHPKTVKLVTDDANAELDEIRATFDEWGVPEDDSFRKWFDDAEAQAFTEDAGGVLVPAEHVGEFGDVLEGMNSGAGMDASEQINDLRRDAMDKMEPAGETSRDG